MRKICKVFFISILTMIVLAFSASAAIDGACGTTATWSLNTETGVLTISGSGSVTMSPWSSYGSSIKNIVVENSITSINEGVFKSCTAVEEMTLPFIGQKESATGYAAVLGFPFGYERSGEDIYYNEMYLEDFGHGVQYITCDFWSYVAGGHVHEDWVVETWKYNIPTTLKKVTLTKGTARGFANSGVKTVVLGENVTKMGKDAFRASAALANIDILGTISTIPADAFKGSGYYKNSSNWENDVLIIDGHLIEYNNWDATEFTATEDIRAIASKAFYKHTNLVKITLPLMEVLPLDVFEGCTSVKEMTVPFPGDFVPVSTEKLTVLAGQVYNSCFKGYSNLKEVVLKDGVMNIGSNAFEGCSLLSLITIPSSVTAFGNNIFSSNVTICGVKGSAVETYASENNIPFITCIHSYGEWVTESDEAYRECINCGERENAVVNGSSGELITWSLNNMTKKLYISGEGDMEDYTSSLAPWNSSAANIEAVIIEDGVTSIGANAFGNCSYLKEITIPESITVINKNAIPEGLGATVYCYVNSYAEDYAVRHNLIVESLDIADRRGTYWSYYETEGRLNVSGVTVSADSEWLDFADNVKSIWVEESVKGINNGAFKCFDSLEEIKLPFIGSSAKAEAEESVFGYIFGYQCLLGWMYEELEAQDPLTTYQYTVDFYMNGELDSDYSDYYCYYIPKTLKKVIYTGTKIPERAFYNCSMLDVAVVMNATTIGKDAFKNSGVTLYSYANNKVYQYAVLNEIAFEAYCTDEVGHNCKTTVYAPTCNATGYTTYYCITCGYSYKSDEVAKLDHEYTSVVTEPTCVAVGYTTHTCKKCGNSYTSDTVKAHGHSYGEWIKNEGFNTSYHKCSVCSATESKTTSGNFNSTVKWFIDLNTEILYISGTGGTDDETATTYGSLYSNKNYYKHIVVEEGITSLGAYTFNKLSNLESVSLPSTLKTLGTSSFNECIKLKKISIPSLSQWLSFDFASYTDCPLYTGSSQLYIGDEILEELVIPAEFTTVKPYSFAGCTSIKSILLPSTVTSIDNAAFYGCKSLTSITFSENMTQIASNAFQACTALEEVTIPENITKINYNAFKGCTALKRAYVLLKTTSFGSSAFGGCTNLTIYGYAGSRAQTYATNNSIPFVVIKEGECITGHTFNEWTIIENTATRGCKNCIATETLNVGGSCGTNAKWLFNPNTGVLTISGSGAMAKYTTTSTSPWTHLADKILTADISGVKSVGDYAFLNCTALTSVVLGNSVETVEKYAFSTCTSLKEVTVGTKLTTFSTRAFINCTAIEKVHVPSLDLWSQIKFQTAESNPASVSGAFYINGEKVTDLVIGDDITAIGNYAFRYADFTSITLPEGLLSIGQAAFAYCTEITEITVPAGVTTLSTSVFKDCTKLVKAVLSSGVETIGNQAFQNCISLETIEIPNSVTSISDNSFAACDKLTIKGSAGSYAETFANQNGIPFEATGHTHTFGDWETVVEPLCERGGVKTRVCSDCGEAETVAIPETGHDYVADVTAPTCTEGGYTTHTCANCDDSYKSDETESTGHSFGDWITDLEPTIEEEGSKHRECSLCGEVETESIPKIVVTGDDAVFTLSGASAKPGSTVKLTLSLKTDIKINSIAVSKFVYDEDILEFVGFGDYEAIEDMPILTAMFDDEAGYILIGFTEDMAFDGDICTLEFKVREGVESTTTEVSASPIVKLGSTSINAKLENAEIEVYSYLTGDIDGDEDVDIDDAVTLFGHSMLPEHFPIDYLGDMDFNDDGNVDIYDAILLFNYSMLPDIYPIN